MAEEKEAKKKKATPQAAEAEQPKATRKKAPAKAEAPEVVEEAKAAKKPKAPARAKPQVEAAAPAAQAAPAPEAKAGAKPRAEAQAKGAPKAAAKTAPKKGAEAGAEASLAAPKTPPRLQEKHHKQVAADLMKEFKYKSAMQVPTVRKIVVNIGMGEALTNAKAIESATADIGAITGQHPVVTRARKSIAGFKIRQGQAIGVSVTLRGRRMWEFLDRLVSSALPRIRDFRGVPRKAFDGRGNYSLGLSEQIIFPEIDYNAVDRLRGLQIVIVTSAINDHEGMRLLELLGMPFARIEKAA